MSYTPTEWKNGDIITAAKMNNIEQGIVDAAGGSFTETDPTVPGWAKQSTKPSYNFSEINNTPTTLSGYGITDVDKIAVVDFAARNYGSSTKRYAYIGYAISRNGSWIFAHSSLNECDDIMGFANDVADIARPLLIPHGGVMYPFIILCDGARIETTGDISSTSENLYYFYGSRVENNCYRVSGSGTVTFVGQ
jgi:hypothetical protein